MNKKRLSDNLTFGSSESLDRQAWGGPRGWESYKDKQCLRNGKLVILTGYEVKSKGCRSQV